MESRLRAMRELSEAGIPTGVNLMPILPFIGDDEAHLEAVVKATANHGGSFVLAAGLTLAGVQARRSLAAAAKLDPAQKKKWRFFYHWQPQGKPAYAPQPEYAARIGKLVKQLCRKHGLAYRIPRHKWPGPLGVNKAIAEKLFLATYELELEMAGQANIWAYRKAAWTIDELELPLDELYLKGDAAGLAALTGIGKALATKIAGWLEQS